MSHTIQLDLRRAMPAIELAVLPAVESVAQVAPANPQSMLSPAVTPAVQLNMRRQAPSLDLAVAKQVEVTAEMLAAIAGPRGDQGPPGPGGGAGGVERSILIDPARPVAYAAFSDRIVRLDYSTQWPPAEAVHATATPEADWPSRTSLEYA